MSPLSLQACLQNWVLDRRWQDTSLEAKLLHEPGLPGPITLEDSTVKFGANGLLILKDIASSILKDD
ncbi:unnamed protein product [Dovyalis caffra]|uniref:Uncharacterized protein n=1 Tax=Dovyalis caffra TaxID=77055 RepID=A0AAV1QUP7_9ROSI|nr:unnamed protein product [Dovyalis caffra]